MPEPKPKQKSQQVKNIFVESPEPVEVVESDVGGEAPAAEAPNACVEEEEKVIEPDPLPPPPQTIERVQPVKRTSYPVPVMVHGSVGDIQLRSILDCMSEVANGGSVRALRAQAVANCPGGDKDAVRKYQEKMRRLRDAAEAAYQSALEQGNMVLLGQ